LEEDKGREELEPFRAIIEQRPLTVNA